VETATTWFTYAVVDMNYPVPVASTWAVEPNPLDLGAPATRAMMTMTTCHPRFSAQYRFIVFSELVETLPKGDGVVPAALAQGA
jgi:sortase A